MIKVLDTKSLDILKETKVEQKYRYVFAMFREQGAVQTYGISPVVFAKFIIQTEKLYNRLKNPFHNFDHGISGRRVG
jgi:hypothetical protein